MPSLPLYKRNFEPVSRALKLSRTGKIPFTKKTVAAGQLKEASGLKPMKMFRNTLYGRSYSASEPFCSVQLANHLAL